MPSSWFHLLHGFMVLWKLSFHRERTENTYSARSVPVDREESDLIGIAAEHW